MILLSHLGLARDEQLAASVAGLDCVVSGHNHQSFERPLLVPGPDRRATPIVQALERRRYRPATLGGKPVEVKYVFRINLRMPR